MDDTSKYKDLYLQTSRQEVQVLNNSLLKLEKNPKDQQAINDIFRSAHTLKSQSAAMGYEKTGFLCHTIEDVFYEIKEGRMEISPKLADILFLSFDSLTASIDLIEREGKEADVSYQAETLKKITGINTLGAGKSERNKPAIDKEPLLATQEVSEATPPPNEPQKIDDKKTEIKTVPVKVEQLDEMMDLFEDLLVQRLRLRKIIQGINNNDLTTYFDLAEKMIDNLQYHLNKARAIELKVIFDVYPRLVRDLAREEQKEVELEIHGGDIELDRAVVERLNEALVHLIRNAISHGIVRQGLIKLEASQEKEYVVISLEDNGRGIDWDKLIEKSGKVKSENSSKDLKSLLFSGISTSEKVTQISGRGVGLRSVKGMIEEFGGAIDVVSEKDKGTKFILKLPLTLAITQALILKVNSTVFALPTVSVDRIVKVPTGAIRQTATQRAFVIDNQEIVLLDLCQRFNLDEAKESGSETEYVLAVVANLGNDKVGLMVDEVVETLDIIVKAAPQALRSVKEFQGATILGDGTTALVLNPQELI